MDISELSCLPKVRGYFPRHEREESLWRRRLSPKKKYVPKESGYD